MIERRVKHLKRHPLSETLGWIGTVGVLSSYALLSTGIIDSSSLLYHSLLGIGSAGLAIVTYRHRAFQSFVVNITFTLLAVLALGRLIFFG